MSDTHIQNPVLHSEQEILNESFNNTYKILESGQYGYQSTTNSFQPLKLDVAGSLVTTAAASGGIVTVAYDTVNYVNTSTTVDTYTYKNATVLVATVTITYTDTSKSQISSVVRT